MNNNTAGPSAVIDIGSSAIRMVVAQQRDHHWQRLDHGNRPVNLGRDVFETGRIATKTMRDVIDILRGFKEVIEGFAVPPNHIRVIATSAVRVASNCDIFLDRVLVRVGFSVEIIEGIEENHLTYLAVRDALRSDMRKFKQAGTLIVESGGGYTDLMLLHRGKMISAHTLNVGSTRLERGALNTIGRREEIGEYLNDTIASFISLLTLEMDLSQIIYFVVIGESMSLASEHLANSHNSGFSVIEREKFETFFSTHQKYSNDEMVEKLGISYQAAESLMVSLAVANGFLAATAAQSLIVPNIGIREGVLLDLTNYQNRKRKNVIERHAIEATMTLGNKYHIDRTHAAHVVNLSLDLFDCLIKEHCLNKHHRVLLEAAAILHDIGNFIRGSGHHKHGQYIIDNSYIFGFTRSDIAIISNIVRYHRKAKPSMAHVGFRQLRRDERIIVMKLASLLRIAEGIARKYRHPARDFHFRITGDNFIIGLERDDTQIVEQPNISRKCDLFSDVYGYNVLFET